MRLAGREWKGFAWEEEDEDAMASSVSFYFIFFYSPLLFFCFFLLRALFLGLDRKAGKSSFCGIFTGVGDNIELQKQ